MSGIVLDILLIAIVLLMVPLGFLRGGLRELCTSAGVLLGILMAQSWSSRVAPHLQGIGNVSLPTATFITTVVIVLVIGGFVGYGGSASFSYRPGLGGRVYGALLSLANGILVGGFLITTWIATMNLGTRPAVIDDSYVARALSAGFRWVLLVSTIGIMAATLLATFVRERTDPAETIAPQTADDFYRVPHREKALTTRPDLPDEETAPALPVRIRQIRHWEEEETQTLPTVSPVKGWSNTWPEGGNAKPWTERPSQGTPPRTAASGQRSQRRDVLKSFLAEDEDNPSGTNGTSR